VHAEHGRAEDPDGTESEQGGELGVQASPGEPAKVSAFSAAAIRGPKCSQILAFGSMT
jgi:hypothetical protein